MTNTHDGSRYPRIGGGMICPGGQKGEEAMSDQFAKIEIIIWTDEKDKEKLEELNNKWDWLNLNDILQEKAQEELAEWIPALYSD